MIYLVNPLITNFSEGYKSSITFECDGPYIDLTRAVMCGEPVKVCLNGWIYNGFIVHAGATTSGPRGAKVQMLVIERPFKIGTTVNVVPPLRFAGNALERAMAPLVKANEPVTIVPRRPGQQMIAMSDGATGIRVRFVPDFDMSGFERAYVSIAQCNAYYEALFMNSKKEPKKMKIRNRFYVGAPNVTTDGEQEQNNVSTDKAGSLSVPYQNPRSNSGSTAHSPGKWTRHTLAGAVEHAEQILNAQPDRDHVAIVRIVRIVRRKKAPLVVEVIK